MFKKQEPQPNFYTAFVSHLMFFLSLDPCYLFRSEFTYKDKLVSVIKERKMT